MTKTLADMSAEERANCVGMWCDNLVSTADNPQPVVLACVQGEQCWILHPDLHGEWSCFSLGSVSPRFDLPRVWTPDGEPVPLGKVQRLQSAVQQMLCELNIYQEQENIGRVREVALDTIETYGLTKEDME